MNDALVDEAWIGFGPFRYVPERNALVEGRRIVPLGGPETALLTALLERPGEIVSKEHLAARMWPDRTVAECNLRWQVSSLRRRLKCTRARRYIMTVSGRGYRFVCPVRRHDGMPAPVRPAPVPRSSSGPGALPPRLPRVIGRDTDIADVGSALSRNRIVTVTGPGGIGKTTVAIAAAHALEQGFADGVVFVDFLPATDPDQIVPLLAAALGLPVIADDMLPALEAALRDRRLLLVFDSCEHVLDAAAELAAVCSEAGADVAVLATSRAPLAIAGEMVLRLGPLAVPPAGAPLAPDAITAFPAVELFLDRLAGARTVDAATAQLIASVCRTLGGHALAIELGAGQAEALGLKSLAALLDDRFLLAMPGGRAASLRHRSLSATFAWSYELLDRDEQWLLRQLSRFEGRFGLAAARAMAPDALLGGRSGGALLAGLVTKSLVATQESETECWFQLLDPIRAFAAEQLAAAGEADAAAERHARLVLAALETGGALPFTHCRNISAALDWAHAAGHRDEAIALALAAAPFRAEQGRVDQSAAEMRRALAVAGDAAPETRMALQFELVGALGVSIGQGKELVAMARALIVSATRVHSARHLLRGFWALWVERINRGDAAGSLVYAQEFDTLAMTMPGRSHLATADRLVGISLHLMGEQAGALARLDRTLAYFAWPERDRANLPYQYDQRILVLAYRARITLLLGQPEAALRMAAAAFAEAEDMRHPLSMIFALAVSYCPIALLLDRHELAERLVAKLAALADAQPLGAWRSIARGLAGWLAASRGAGTPASLRNAVADLRSEPFGPIQVLALGGIAQALGDLGNAAEAIETIDFAIDEADRAGVRWCGPELSRIRAELDPGAAPALLDMACEQARRQGARFWEARIEATRASLNRAHS